MLFMISCPNSKMLVWVNLQQIERGNVVYGKEYAMFTQEPRWSAVCLGQTEMVKKCVQKWMEDSPGASVAAPHPRAAHVLTCPAAI